MDFANMKARKVGVFTDSTLAKLLPMQMALESLDANNVSYEVFDRTRVEPNQESCVLFLPLASPTSTSGRLLGSPLSVEYAHLHL